MIVRAAALLALVLVVAGVVLRAASPEVSGASRVSDFPGAMSATDRVPESLVSQTVFFSPDGPARETHTPLEVDWSPPPELEGVVFDGTTVRVILAVEGGQRQAAMVGDVVAGWTIVSVQERSVTLQRGGAQVVRQLFARSE